MVAIGIWYVIVSKGIYDVSRALLCYSEWLLGCWYTVTLSFLV